MSLVLWGARKRDTQLKLLGLSVWNEQATHTVHFIATGEALHNMPDDDLDHIQRIFFNRVVSR